jgi:predicted homoserine dehydrogenase-like protein
MACGDQPTLICELGDWCRSAGFDVVAADKGTRYLPEYNFSMPNRKITAPVSQATAPGGAGFLLWMWCSSAGVSGSGCE